MATATDLVTSLDLNRSVSLTLKIRNVPLLGQSMLNNKQQLQVAWPLHDLYCNVCNLTKKRNNNNVMNQTTSVWFWQ